jgi:hypothetical protein
MRLNNAQELQLLRKRGILGECTLLDHGTATRSWRRARGTCTTAAPPTAATDGVAARAEGGGGRGYQGGDTGRGGRGASCPQGEPAPPRSLDIPVSVGITPTGGPQRERKALLAR